MFGPYHGQKIASLPLLLPQLLVCNLGCVVIVFLPIFIFCWGMCSVQLGKGFLTMAILSDCFCTALEFEPDFPCHHHRPMMLLWYLYLFPKNIYVRRLWARLHTFWCVAGWLGCTGQSESIVLLEEVQAQGSTESFWITKNGLDGGRKCGKLVIGCY